MNNIEMFASFSQRRNRDVWHNKDQKIISSFAIQWTCSQCSDFCRKHWSSEYLSLDQNYPSPVGYLRVRNQFYYGQWSCYSNQCTGWSPEFLIHWALAVKSLIRILMTAITDWNCRLCVHRQGFKIETQSTSSFTFLDKFVELSRRDRSFRSCFARSSDSRK